MKKENDYFLMGNRYENYLGLEEIINKYDVPSFNFNIENKNDSHCIIANLVKEKSRVLDVGCATGIIGKLLKQNKKSKIDGIEYDKVSFNMAKEMNIYENIYNCSITETNSKEFQEFYNNKIKYDYIIFADILEHLINPWEVLYCFSAKLKKGGKILISIPNISHIDIIKGLLNDQFNYNNVGILDSTHIRFFTATSFIEMIKNFNERYDRYFSINYVDKTTCIPSYIKNPDEIEERYFIVQNIFELTLVENKNEIKYENQPEIKDNYFEFINEVQNLKKKNTELILENEQLSDKNRHLEDQINKILNSKSWKMISKMRNIWNKIKHRSNTK